MSPRYGLGLLAVLACGAVPALQAQGKAAPKRKPARPCDVVLEEVTGSTLFSQGQGNGQSTMYIGGGVKLSCRGQNITLASDSLISYDGYDTFVMIGNVRYHDDDYDVTTDTLRRYKVGERMELRGRAVVRASATQSTLQAPSIDYYRQVPKVNEIARMLATGRVDAMIFPKPDPKAKAGTGESPYHVVADRLNQTGETNYDAFGDVRIDRDSLRVFGDSVKYAAAKGTTADVWGAPARVLDVAADSAHLHGRHVTIDMAADETIREARAFGEVVFVRGGATITSDTLHVLFRGGKVNGILAWAAGGKAHLFRDGYDAYADSLAVESRADQISKLRLFRHGRVEQPLDSVGVARAPEDSAAAPRRDWIAGERVVISFAQADSAGTTLTLVQQLEATTKSCSLYSRAPASRDSTGGTGSASINYTCADRITVEMKPGLERKVDTVRFRGNVNGAVLQPDPARKPAGPIATPAGARR